MKAEPGSKLHYSSMVGGINKLIAHKLYCRDKILWENRQKAKKKIRDHIKFPGTRV